MLFSLKGKARGMGRKRAPGQRQAQRRCVFTVFCSGVMRFVLSVLVLVLHHFCNVFEELVSVCSKR